MTDTNTFLTRLQPLLDAMPEGADKTKLQLLVECQDIAERSDAPPRERARAMRRLLEVSPARQENTLPAPPGRKSRP